MIIVLFGQPTSGKSTLASYIIKTSSNFINIDGDDLRKIFKNKDYSKKGRIKNLNRASDIATYLNSADYDVVLSLIYPYKETRDYLNNLCENVKWIYLTYDGERERDLYHVEDFDIPRDDENVLTLNTSKLSIQECINKMFP
jgi:adenylylsulfate kinase-like enzyme